MKITLIITTITYLQDSPEGHVPKGSGDVEGIDFFYYDKTKSSRSDAFAVYHQGKNASIVLKLTA